jgi:hypothetical protein
MDLHDIVKLLIVRKILRKNKNKTFLRIYTEFDLDDGKLVPDIYVESLKESSIICYEIQKTLYNDYTKSKTEQYNKLDIFPFNSIDLIVIPIKDCPNEINKISDWLDTYVI